MRMAISIDDDVFRRAGRLARRMKKTRSRLFSEAIREYVARHSPDELNVAMNAALSESEEGRDEFLCVAARRALERTEW